MLTGVSLHIKERSFDIDLGHFSQPLNTFNGKTDGAFYMDKIGGTQIVKDVSLGWKFIITIL